MKNLLFVSFLTAFAVSRCTSSNNAISTAADSGNTNTGIAVPAPATADTGNIAGRWNLIPAMASDTATGQLPYLVFENESVSGNTGCNSFRGGYKKTGSSLTFDNKMISTKMACAGYDENAFIKNLLRITSYDVKGDTLVLKADVTPISYWLKGR